MESEIKDYGKISTGSVDITKWLNGGYEKGIITMIAGPPGSGKTNFSILVSCSQAKKQNKVIFIDTEGGFSPERVRQIVGEENDAALENIFILNPTNFEEQKKHFSKLLEQIKNNQISLLVIDGIAMLYRLEFAEASRSKEGERIKNVNSELAKQMRDLAEISRKQNIPIILTNQVYTEFLSEEKIKNGVERQVNIVGGDLLKYWSKCIIELKKSGNRRKAVLIKHRSMPQKEIGFEIKNKGIFRRGLF